MMHDSYRLRRAATRTCAGVFKASVTVAAILGAFPLKAAESNPLYRAIGSPEGFKLRASVRSRVEAIDGQFRPGRPQSDFMWSLRTSLFAEYDTGPLRIGAELNDARGYGEKDNSSVGVGEIDTMELVQGYVAFDIDNRLGKGSKAALTVGRFALDIGSGRLVSRSDFPNTISSFTGINLDWRGASKDRLVAFWVMPQTRLPNDAAAIHHNAIKWDHEGTELQFFGASYTKAALGNGISGEVYGYKLDERDTIDQPSRNRHLLTAGARVMRSPGTGPFDFDVEVVHQSGHARATVAASDRKNLDVSAHFIHAEIGRKFADGWTPRLSLHFDDASGDGPGADSYGRFDTLFGARRSEFGPTSLYGPVGRANLVSGGIRLEAKPAKTWDFFVMGRGLWLESATDSFSATGVRDRTGSSGKYAGTQIETRVRYWLVPKRVRFEVGGAYLAKGRFLDDAPKAPATGDTRYLYFDVSADF